MDSKFTLASLVLFLFINQGHCVSKVFTVTAYGAVSDGRTDASKAFLSAWIDACGTNGGLMYIPKGTYYVSGASFMGPCNGETLIQNDGYVLASSALLNSLDYWILFEGVDSLMMYGQGIFDGNGGNTWESRSKIGRFPPTSIKFEQVTDSQIQGLTSTNSKAFHISLNGCGNVVFDQVKLSAPEDSPNTDGIHVARSHDINITNSRISTGDDCISIGDGTHNINVSSIWCGPGHGISIGSLGKYEDEESVSGIRIMDCNLTNTMNGLRIKTWPKSSSMITVSNVVFSNIHLKDVDNPVIIDQYYCPGRSCNNADASSVKIEDVKFLDIKGTTSSEVAVTMACSKSRPCEGILLQGLNITTSDGQLTTASCYNANGQFVGDDQIPSRCSPPSIFAELE